MSKIKIVSCGPGGEDYFTPAAMKALRKADVIIGASRLLALFPGHQAEKIEMCGGINSILKPLENTIHNKQVVVLVSGDAGLHSLAFGIVKHFGRELCTIIPGISSIQVACSRLAIPWQNAEIINLHHGVEGPKIAALTKKDVYLVLTGHYGNWQWIKSLVNNKINSHKAFILQDLTLAEEKTEPFPCTEFKSSDFSTRTIVAVVSQELL